MNNNKHIYCISSDSSDLYVFFVQVSVSFPLCRASSVLIIISMSLLHHTLSLSLFPLCSRADRPHIAPCRIITMSPWALMSAPCICPTRGAAVEATTASSLRRWFLQTGAKPLTLSFTSRTGNPRLSRTVCPLPSLLDLERRSVEYECGHFQHAHPLTDCSETAARQNKLPLWALVDCVSSLSE